MTFNASAISKSKSSTWSALGEGHPLDRFRTSGKFTTFARKIYLYKALEAHFLRCVAKDGMVSVRGSKGHIAVGRIHSVIGGC